MAWEHPGKLPGDVYGAYYRRPSPNWGLGCSQDANRERKMKTAGEVRAGWFWRPARGVKRFSQLPGSFPLAARTRRWQPSPSICSVGVGWGTNSHRWVAAGSAVPLAEGTTLTFPPRGAAGIAGQACPSHPSGIAGVCTGLQGPAQGGEVSWGCAAPGLAGSAVRELLGKALPVLPFERRQLWAVEDKADGQPVKFGSETGPVRSRCGHWILQNCLSSSVSVPAG